MQTKPQKIGYKKFGLLKTQKKKKKKKKGQFYLFWPRDLRSVVPHCLGISSLHLTLNILLAYFTVVERLGEKKNKV